MIRLMRTAAETRSKTQARPLARLRGDGLMVVPCQGEDADLAVVWDPIEEQIVDVIAAPAGWSDADDLWLEGRQAPTDAGADTDWRAAA